MPHLSPRDLGFRVALGHARHRDGLRRLALVVLRRSHREEGRVCKENNRGVMEDQLRDEPMSIKSNNKTRRFSFSGLPSLQSPHLLEASCKK